MNLKKYDKETQELARKYSQQILKRPLLEQVQAEKKEKFKYFLKEENPKFKNDVIDKITNCYALFFNKSTEKLVDNLLFEHILKLYTKEELTAIIQFYETDIGYSIFQKNTLLLEKIADPFATSISYDNLHAIDDTRIEMNKFGIQFKY